MFDDDGDEEYEVNEELFERFPSHIFLLDAMHQITFRHVKMPILVAICYMAFVISISLFVALRLSTKRPNRRQRIKFMPKKRPQDRPAILLQATPLRRQRKLPDPDRPLPRALL